MHIRALIKIRNDYQTSCNTKHKFISYTTLLGLLKNDYGKQIIRMSDSCSMDFPPDPAFQISLISNAAKSKPVVWADAAQAKMLYGQQQTEHFLINLLGSSFANRA